MSRYVETSELRKLAESKPVLIDTRGEPFGITGDDDLFVHLRDGRELEMSLAFVRVENAQLVGQLSSGAAIAIPMDSIERARIGYRSAYPSIAVVLVVLALALIAVVAYAFTRPQGSYAPP